MEERAKSILAYIDNMPPLPPTVGRIISIANDPMSSITDMDKVIALDPVISGKVLKLVNSAYFGLREKITNTSRAIAHVGMNTMKNLALTAVVMQKLSENAKNAGIDLEEFWRHSLGCSMAAKIFARRAGIGAHAAEDCGLAGLMHDIGTLVLINFSSKEYINVIEFARGNHVSLIAAERRILPVDSRMVITHPSDGGPAQVETQTVPIDHSYIGRRVAEKWNLPEVISDPIAFHHFPNQSSGFTEKFVHCVFVADVFCKMQGCGFGGDTFTPKIPQYTMELLNLMDTDFQQIEPLWQRDMDGAQDFLDAVSH